MRKSTSDKKGQTRKVRQDESAKKSQSQSDKEVIRGAEESKMLLMIMLLPASPQPEAGEQQSDQRRTRSSSNKEKINIRQASHQARKSTSGGDVSAPA